MQFCSTAGNTGGIPHCIAPEFLSDGALLALQLGFLTVAYPSLVITYLGQAAYLMINPDNYATTFYACIPSPVYWPVFVIAVLAAIVASQVIEASPFGHL